MLFKFSAILLFIHLLLFYMGASLSIAEFPETERTSNLPERCEIQKSMENIWNNFSCEEKKAWGRICEGKPVNFNDAPNKPLDPAMKSVWTPEERKKRELRSSFLETILLKKPWRELIPHNGVYIIGAWFGDDGINLENAELRHQLKLEKSRFKGVVNFAHAISSFGISFKKSFFSRQFNISWAKIEGPLEMDKVKFYRRAKSKGAFVQETPIEEKESKWVFMRGLKVNSDLIMNDGNFLPVDLQLAKIGGRINLANSNFRQSGCPEFADQPFDRPYCEESFLMAGSQIDGEINMNQAEFLGKVSLRGAEVGNIVSMENATLGKELYMEGMRIKGDLVLEGGNFQKVVMKGAEVDGDFLMSGEEKKGKMATFGGDVEMYRIRVRDQLVIKGAKFSGKLFIHGAFVGSNLDFSESTFDKEVNLNSANLGRNFYLDKAKFKDKLELVGITVSGTLSFKASRFPDLRESSFDKEVRLNSANIGKDLILNEAKFQSKVEIYNTKVADRLIMRNARFSGSLSMNEISVGSNLDLRESIFDKEVKLKVAKIGRDLCLCKAEFKDELDMTGINVSGSLFFTDGRFSKSVIVSLSKIGIINYQDTYLDTLDLTGTHVNKVLVKSTANVKLPIKLILHGFTYDQFILTGEKKGDIIQNEDLYKAWMTKVEDYSPQPYEQAATVLLKSGQPEFANTMLYAGKEREREKAWKEHNIKGWLWLTGLKYTIGYGFGMRYFRAFGWLAVLVLLGTYVCYTAREHENLSELVVPRPKTNQKRDPEKKDTGKEPAPDQVTDNVKNVANEKKPGTDQSAEISLKQDAKTPGLLVCMFYSLDMLLPLIKLWGKHERIDMPPLQCYYFYIHKMFGWLLFTFVLAGLTGLTKG